MIVEPATSGLHYRIADKIAEAAMGLAWKVVDTMLAHEVAIKVLPRELTPHPEPLARFDRGPAPAPPSCGC